RPYFARQFEAKRNAAPLDNVAQRALMRRIAVTVQQDDDRDLDTEPDQLLRNRNDIRLRQGIELAAVRGDAAADLAHQGARDQWLRPARVEAHRVRDSEALQFEEIAEAARHDHPDLGALALDQRVGRDRAAMRV